MSESVKVGTVEYPIDSETAKRLREGDIPSELKSRITAEQGSEFCFDFCRQRRLMKRILDQIEDKKQPGHLRPLIESGAVPSEILYKLYHHHLIAKAEKMYQGKLISDKVMDTVREKLLTEEILKPLSYAFSVDTALYLYSQNEISQDILQGVKDGSVDPMFIRIIRRHYRYMTHQEEQQDKHSIHALDKEGNPINDLGEQLEDSSHTYDFDMDSFFARELLTEAMEWLTENEKELLRLIYYEHLPLTNIARQYHVTEGTIRYRRDQLLKRLRFILEDCMKLTSDDLLM